MMRRDEKHRILLAAEMMTEDVKRANRVAEVACHLFRGATIDKIGPEGFINPLFGIGWIQEKRTTLT
jgi:hypothetical protein